MFTLEQVVPWGRSFDEYRRTLGLKVMDDKLPESDNWTCEVKWDGYVSTRRR